MSRKHLVVAITMLLVAAMVAGCAQPAPTATPRPTVAPTKAPVAQPTAVPAEPGGAFMAQLRKDGYIGPALTTENITLRMLRTSRQAYEEALYKRWNEEFMAAFPNIKIEEEVIPFGDLFQKIQVIIAGGSPPDAMIIDGPFVKSYCYFDILAPLNTHVAAEYLADYVPATFEEHTCGDMIYAFPHQQASCAIFFNRDKFVAAGLERPPETTDINAGWTWEQFMEAWKKLTVTPAGAAAPDVWGLAPSEFGAGGVGSNYYLEGMYIRGKGDPKAPKDSEEWKTYASISEDGTDVKGYLDSDLAIEGMKFYQSIFQVEKVSPTAGMPNSFPDQRAATVLGTDAWVKRIQAANASLNFGVSPIPHYSDGVPFTHGGSTTFAVTKGAKYPNEAFALLMYWHNLKNRIEFHQVTGSLPALISVFAELPYYQKLPDSLFQATLVEFAMPRPPGPGYSQYQSVSDLAIKDIGLGADVASTLHAAADELNGYLAQFKK